MYVIKIGGHELDEPSFLPQLAQAVASIDAPVVIVHGGGQAIAVMQARLGLTPRKVAGLRVTDEASLQVAQMVLSGDVNKRIVQTLSNYGVPSVGLSGVDAALLRCTKKRFEGYDLGWVGEVSGVNKSVLEALVKSGYTPVISPISLGLDGAVYNVNADEAASAIGAALGVQKVWFISNVAAVLDRNSQPIATMTSTEAAQLIESGAIRDGMIPKVLAAFEVVESGVPEVIITNIGGLGAGQGTRLVGVSSNLAA